MKRKDAGPGWFLKTGAMCALLVTGLATATDAQQLGLGMGGIKGQVRDSAGHTLNGVELTIEGSTQRFQTDDQGGFELAQLRAGPLTLYARRLGFRPDTVDIMVLAGKVVPVDIVLKRIDVQLSPVVVVGRTAYTGWRAGFYSRRELGTGYFFTREDIEKRNPSMFTDMFRTIPGARIVRNDGIIRNHIRFRGASCPPLVWIDGSPAGAGEFDLDALSPNSIEAVEVYPGQGPMQYRVNTAIAPACGTVLVWSREGQRRPPKRNTSTAYALARAVEDKQIFTANEVDIAAREDSANPVRPRYPDQLHDDGVSGTVLAEFVVEASGEVNPQTVSVVFASHPLFGQAVEEALREAIYSPAVRQGYPVRQVVQHEFRFVPDSNSRKK
ncbi:MAG TPA: carboxypeptidase regulatory-like domain-containing protein [Gemmatimonadaceae bacterium]